MRSKLKGPALGLALGFLGMSAAGLMVGRSLAALEGAYTYIRLFNEVLSLVRSSYVDPVEEGNLMKGAYEGLLAELDPYSEYLSAQDYAEYRQSPEDASGAVRRSDAGIRVARKEGITLIVAVRPGSDAEGKGITPGDQLRRIGDRSTREMSLRQIDTALAGPAGRQVAVSVARREEPRKIDADLTFKELPPAPATLELSEPKDGTAVLRIPHFGTGAAAEIASALERAERQKVRKLMVDLRGNAWGRMDEAARAAGLFAGQTVVARIKGRDGVVSDLRADRSRAGYSGTLAVLVNGATVEAAELFAAALHDLLKAPILGEPTFGVGAQQELLPLKNGAWLKLSVRKYVSPSGQAWHGSGLTPDTPISIAQENLAPSDRLRQQLRKAMDQLRGAAPVSSSARDGVKGHGGA